MNIYLTTMSQMQISRTNRNGERRAEKVNDPEKVQFAGLAHV